MGRPAWRGSLALLALACAVSAVSAAAAQGAPGGPQVISTLCLDPADAGDIRCRGDQLETKWAWDGAKRGCAPFDYYGCGGNSNNFESEADCLSVCTGVSPGCDCDASYEPVCAAISSGGDGGDNQGAPQPPAAAGLRTFDNKCLAACAGAAVVHRGPCLAEGGAKPRAAARGPPQRSLLQSPGCICTKELRPVCAGGRDFGNPCLARCGGFDSYTPGRCGALPASPKPGACACSLLYRPVCGAPGGGGARREYPNACVAKCDGAADVTDGRCGDAANSSKEAAESKNADGQAPAAAEAPSTPPAAGAAAAGGSGGGGGGAGAARPGCPCTREFRPVCLKAPGAEPKQFPNPCVAKCAGVAANLLSTGPCPPPAAAAVPVPGCVCTAVYMPVCGADGKTYSNRCTATCRGVAVASNAPCDGQGDGAPAPPAGAAAGSAPPASPKPCVCPKILRPVCGEDGKTYGNGCLAKCKDVIIVSEGECKGGSAGATSGESAPPAPPAGAPAGQACGCSRIYRPVCGEDGRDYANDCLATCAGAAVASEGPCAGAKPAAGGAGAAPSAPPARPQCACAKIMRPVCGKDGKTYGNECLAKCAGTTVAAQGECKPAAAASAPSAPPAGAPRPGCVCPKIYRPVCGADGRTYGNSCDAGCRGVAVAAQGECKPAAAASAPSTPPAARPQCACAKIMRPVCGKDGRTYNNECLAKCAGTTVASEGECKGPAPAKACACPMNYAPVCSAGRRTYSNACAAKCAGATVAYEGACRASPAAAPAGSAGPKPAPAGTAGGAAGAKPAPAAAGAGGAGAKPAAAPGSAAAAPAGGCKCGRDYAPQCGLDGKTYANPCLAKCANATQAYPGPCTDACKACSRDIKPVCAASKSYGPRTYANCCFVKCAGLKPATDVVAETACRLGACATACLKEPRAPVCCGGKTYANACLAKQCHYAKDCKPGACAKRLCA